MASCLLADGDVWLHQDIQCNNRSSRATVENLFITSNTSPTVMYTIIYCNKATKTLSVVTSRTQECVCIHTHTSAFCRDWYKSPELTTSPQHVQSPPYQHERRSQKHLQQLRGGAGCVHPSIWRTGQRSRKRLNKGRPVKGQVTRTRVQKCL